MLPDLPQPIARYLAAERAKDADKLAEVFARDGVVKDEGREHRGRSTIRKWKRAADAKYRYTLEPLSTTADGKSVNVRVRLTGDFPGSPIEVDHIFTIDGDEIASLEIR